MSTSARKNTPSVPYMAAVSQLLWTHLRVIKHGRGTWLFSIAKPSRNSELSIAMFVYNRVTFTVNIVVSMKKCTDIQKVRFSLIARRGKISLMLGDDSWQSTTPKQSWQKIIITRNNMWIREALHIMATGEHYKLLVLFIVGM